MRPRSGARSGGETARSPVSVFVGEAGAELEELLFGESRVSFGHVRLHRQARVETVAHDRG